MGEELFYLHLRIRNAALLRLGLRDSNTSSRCVGTNRQRGEGQNGLVPYSDERPMSEDLNVVVRGKEHGGLVEENAAGMGIPFH